MRFEWDVAKNKTNLRDHKIDFADARFVFDSALLVDMDERQHRRSRCIYRTQPGHHPHRIDAQSKQV